VVKVLLPRSVRFHYFPWTRKRALDQLHRNHNFELTRTKYTLNPQELPHYERSQNDIVVQLQLQHYELDTNTKPYLLYSLWPRSVLDFDGAYSIYESELEPGYTSDDSEDEHIDRKAEGREDGAVDMGNHMSKRKRVKKWLRKVLRCL
jgi:hypothetical protein